MNGSEKSKFAVTLGRLRREKGLSQRKAAAELGISQALLSHYETDAREPKLDFVIKVCDYYAVTSDYILGRTNERGDGASRIAGTLSLILDSFDEIKTSEAEIMNKLRKLTQKDY